MKIIRKIIEPTALIVLLVGGFGMLASTFLGTADVIGTQVFGQPAWSFRANRKHDGCNCFWGAYICPNTPEPYSVELFYTRWTTGPRFDGCFF